MLSQAVVELLIESGAHLEIVNNHGYTPLHSAVHYGRSEIVAVLIQSAADVNAVTYDSQVYLFFVEPTNLQLVI